jgi:hypothetical protein
MKSQAIAAILSSLNDELERLHNLGVPGLRPSDEDWERVRVILRAYHAVQKIPADDVDLARLGRINNEGGALSWCGRSFGAHPDRCVCQGDDPGPHRHYDHAPYRCARCGKCESYNPVPVEKASP